MIARHDTARHTHKHKTINGSRIEAVKRLPSQSGTLENCHRIDTHIYRIRFDLPFLHKVVAELKSKYLYHNTSKCDAIFFNLKWDMGKINVFLGGPEWVNLYEFCFSIFLFIVDVTVSFMNMQIFQFEKRNLAFPWTFDVVAYNQRPITWNTFTDCLTSFDENAKGIPSNQITTFTLCETCKVVIWAYKTYNTKQKHYHWMNV